MPIPASTKRPTAHLVGRDAALADVSRLLLSGRLVSLTGVGGSGKTALARGVAETVADAVDTSWTAELAGVTDPEQISQAVAQAAGLQVGPGPTGEQQLIELIGDRDVLAILDNCEHLTEGVADLAGSLLRACQNLRILITSRHALGLVDEAVYAVPPLAVPPPHLWEDAVQLHEFSAVTLFEQRAQTVDPGFAVSATNSRGVGRLCELVSGLPLALELAAAQVGKHTPDELGTMLARADDAFDDVSLTDRQRSMAASVSWSHHLCTPSERELWARLSVFVGGFDLESAEAVCADDVLGAYEVLDLIASLLDKSVISRESVGATVHYRMLEPLRQFGARRLADADTVDDFRARHTAWFLQLAGRTAQEWISDQQVDWNLRLRLNYANLRVAFDAGAQDPAHSDAVLSAYSALEGFWIASGTLSEGRRWAAQALAQPDGDREVRAKALATAVNGAMLQMDIAAADAYLTEFERMDLGQHERALRAAQLYAQAMKLFLTGQTEPALTAIQFCVTLLPQKGWDRQVAAARVAFGAILQDAGRLPAGRESLEDLLDWLPDGERCYRAFALWILTAGYLATGDVAAACAAVRHGLHASVELSNHLGLAVMFESAAAVTGDPQKSATLLGAARRIWRFVGESSLSAPYVAAHRDLGRANSHGELGNERFVAAYSAGEAMRESAAVEYALEACAEPTAEVEAPSLLTPREQEVASLIVEGLSNRQIAERLRISVRTSHGHVEHILHKLGFTSRTQVAVWVLAQHSRT